MANAENSFCFMSSLQSTRILKLKWKLFVYNSTLVRYSLLSYRHEYFTGKHTTRKVQTKLQPEKDCRIFHILTTRDSPYHVR